ncbi:MAG: hypothetical protein LBG59_00715 [Candidatus Peribacteria bacterium]|nr:hypothetical protein [Candidatus Peribacteria bacterium]
MKKDSCPHGDFSSSYYDKTCGTIPLSEEEHSKDTGDGKEELEANDQ